MFYVERSKIIPESLLTGTSRNEDDVKNQLSIDFYNKCYLCEFSATSLEVDHFKPKSVHQHLIQDWANLFLCCRYCNSTKYASDHILLDCTDVEHKVEQLILHILDLDNDNITFLVNDNYSDYIKNSGLSEAVDNTKKLLEKIFNKNKSGMYDKDTKNLRKHLAQNFNKLKELLLFYEHFPDCAGVDLDIHKRLKEELSKKADFSAFKRYFIEMSRFKTLSDVFD